LCGTARREHGERQHYHRLSHAAHHCRQAGRSAAALKTATGTGRCINIGKARSEDCNMCKTSLPPGRYDSRRRSKDQIIFENAYLDDAAKIRLCEICARLRRLVKTQPAMPSGASMPSRTHAQTLAARGSQGCRGIRDLDALLPCERSGQPRRRTRTDHARRLPQRLGLEPIAQSLAATRRRILTQESPAQ